MSLVNVKCPNCGASIQLDDTRKEGFCSYCGSKVQVEEAIKKIKIDKSGEIKNYLEIANNAFQSGNAIEALSYANRILEIDPKNAEAWSLKAASVANCSTINDFRCGEIITAGNKAIEYDCSPSNKNNVYRLYIISFCNDLNWSIQELNDYGSLQEIYETGLSVYPPDKASEQAQRTDFSAPAIVQQLYSLLELRKSIPTEALANSKDFLDDNGECIIDYICASAKLWIGLQNALERRYESYGVYLNNEGLKVFKEGLREIRKGLPADKQQETSEKDFVVFNPNTAQATSQNSNYYSNEETYDYEDTPSGGCYIATAVYGSYDCPQVWALRRYRDNCLALSWYGRAFVRLYYAISPTLVRLFGKTIWFKTSWRIYLDNLVARLIKRGYQDTPYNDIKW